MLATFARADGLIKRAPFAPAMAAGTAVAVLPLAAGPDRRLSPGTIALRAGRRGYFNRAKGLEWPNLIR